MPRSPSLATAFAARAKATPARVALFDRRERITFGELEASVRAVAAGLEGRGVSPGGRVGLSVPRSIDAVIATLAVFWRGATVVPLDPAWPRARRDLVVDDAALHFVVEADGPNAVASLARIGPAAGVHDEAPRDPGDAPAHLLYTSGSTGHPKGVILDHETTLARVRALGEVLPFAEHDVACLRTPPTFVDANAELFGPLLAGVPIYVPPHPFDLADVVDALATHGVTRLVLVPSLLALLLDAAPDLGARAKDLRLVVSSGEALPGGLARRFFAATPRARLVNVYGSTEVGGDATFAEIDRATCEVPLGRALPGASLALAGANDPRAPAEGELLVGGAMLARGYWRRPELDEARFTRDAATGARHFRTGDLVRRDENGVLWFVGRSDGQVKLGGVRIELGEIERHLLALEGVEEAGAVLLDGPPPCLVAAIAGQGLDDAAVRAALARALPSSSVPQRISVLARLPRTSHGKIDRPALARAIGQATTTEVTPPDDSLVRRVARWMQEAVGGDIVSEDAYFEAVGGDSFARLRLLVRLAREGFEIPLRDVPHPLTARRLADALSTMARPEPPPPFVLPSADRTRLVRSGYAPETALPLTDFQRFMIAESVANAKTCVWGDQIAYRVDGAIDPARFEAAWREEIAVEPALRRAFVWRAYEEPLQVVVDEAPFALAVVDARAADARAYRRRVLAEEWTAMSTVFDLGRAPLFRVCLLRGPSERNDVVLTYHHALLDGESSRIVLRRVLARYATGTAPAKSSPAFGAFVARTRGPEGARAAELVTETLAGYASHDPADGDGRVQGGDAVWQGFHRLVGVRRRVAQARLAGRRGLDRDLARLLDGSAAPASSYAGGDMGTTPLSVAFARALTAWCRARAVSPAAAWAALYAIVLARETGARDVVFGVILSARDGASADTVGMLANCLPLRLRVAEEDRVVDLVDRAATRLKLLERAALAPLGAVDSPPARAAAMHHWLVSWSYDEDRPVFPGLRVGDGRGVTVASTHLALVVSRRGEGLEIGVGSRAYLEVDRVRRHVLSLADALMDVTPATRVGEWLARDLPDGGMWVGLPDL